MADTGDSSTPVPRQDEEAGISSACMEALSTYLQGGTHRTKAKEALRQLLSDHPHSYLPHRFMARLLYHEAAVLEAQQQLQTGGQANAERQRIALLLQALDHATRGTSLQPNSLSSAALRATLVVNVLVEESALQAPAASAANIKEQFQNAMSACSQAAQATDPVLAEPVINITDDGCQTCDPCSLRIQDQIQQWVRAGRWDYVVQEKRNVLVCMQQVLQSCHTLLDSTQIPVDGVVRLLQHILRSLLPHRPVQNDLQGWANQFLGSTVANSPESQALLRAQQTLLQQGSQLQQPLAMSPAGPAPAQAPKTDSHPEPSSATTPPATTSQPQIQPPAATKPSRFSAQPAAAPAPAPVLAPAPPQAMRSVVPTTPKPPPQQPNAEPMALFEQREWDWDKELGGSSGGASSGGGAPPTGNSKAAQARRKLRAKANSRAATASHTRSKERSHKERYTEVESFWCSLNHEQRMEYLRVPLGPLLLRMRNEVGQDVVDGVCEGLVMLQEQGILRSTCYWTCVMCEQKFTQAKDFLSHIEVAHEEVAVQGGKYVMCGKCQVEVVGMYYTSTCVADYSLCARCFQQELNNVPEISSAYERIYPKVPSVNGPQRWSDTGSDFISTRDSFTSGAEDPDQLDGPATPQAVQAGPSNQWPTAAGAKQAPGKPLGLPAWGPLPATPAQPPQPAAGPSVFSSPTKPAATSPGPSPSKPTEGGSSTSAAGAPGPHPAAGSQPASSTANTPAPSVPSFGMNLGGPGQPPPFTFGENNSDAAGSTASWWAGRLFQTWDSTSQPGATDAGKDTSQQQPQPQRPLRRPLTPADTAPPTPAPPTATGPSRTEQKVRRSSSRNSVSSAARSAHRSPLRAHGSAHQMPRDGAAAPAGPTAHKPGGHGVDGPLDGSQDTVASVGALSSSERRQLVAVVDEILQRIRDIYAANHSIGDAALASISQFTERKISALLKQHILPSEAPSVRPQLEEFLSQPSCVFRKPDVLRGALRCLTLTDLHMVLVYVVRQHADAVSDGTGSGLHAANALLDAVGAEAGLPAHGPRPVTGSKRSLREANGGLEGDSEADEGEWESSCECDEEDEEEGEDDEDEGESGEMDEEEEEEEEEEDGEGEEEEEDSDVEDVAPPPLFEVDVPSVTALHTLIADVWQRDDESGEDAPPNGGGPAAAGGKGSAGGANTASKAAGKVVRNDPVQSEDQLLTAGLSSGAKKSPPKELTSQAWVLPSPWWLAHLTEHSPSSTEQAAALEQARKLQLPVAKCAGVLRSLQWVYGRVVNTASEVFLQRQREYRAGRERDAALLDLYDDLAYGWRSLQAALDQRARLEELRKGARAQFAVVRHIEEEGRHCHAEEAAEFLEVLMASHHAAIVQASESGAPMDRPRLNMCEAAVDVVRRHPALAGEASQRYARALLDRELSALLLVEAMLAAEVDEATRSRTAAEDNLKKHRAEARDTESEYSRLEAEGPACHRKKDMLDKATKEAEHRERLQDLQQRLVTVTEKINTEEGNKTKASERLAEAERDLKAVREQLRNHSARRKHLDELCAQLEVPMPPALMLQQQQQQQFAMQAPPSLPATSVPSSYASPDSADSSPVSHTSHSPQSPSHDSPKANAPLSPEAAEHPSAAPQAPPSTTSPPPTLPSSDSSPTTSPQILPVPSRHLSLSTPGGISTTPPSSEPPQSTPPPAPVHTTTLDLSTTPAAAPAAMVPATGPAATALAVSMPDPSSTLPTQQVMASPVTLEEWHKQRLEVLMYRLMWVSEAVKNFQDQYSPHARTRHYELFLKATSWAKSLADEYEQQVRGWYSELDKLREKLLEQACVDLGLVLHPHILDAVRRRVERGARMAQEQASLSLLAELEQEETKKTSSAAAMGALLAGAAPAGAANSVGAAGKGTAKTKKQKAADKAREKKEKEEAERLARAAEDEARKRAEEEERVRLAEAKRARELAIEAELERRRKELEALEAQREAEAIRLAKEASLREAALRAKQQQEEQEKAAQLAQLAAKANTAVSGASQRVQDAAFEPSAPAHARMTGAVPRNAVRANAARGAAGRPGADVQQYGVVNAAVTSQLPGSRGNKPAVQQQQQQQQQHNRPGGSTGQAAHGVPHRPQLTSTPPPPAPGVRLPPHAAAALAAATAAAAEAAGDTSAPRASNRHAPKFTHPANANAPQARHAANSAARLLSLATDAAKPQAQQPQQAQQGHQMPAHVQAHPRNHSGMSQPAASSQPPMEDPHAHQSQVHAAGSQQRSGRAPIHVSAKGSPANRPARGLPMPQTPEHRAAPPASAIPLSTPIPDYHTLTQAPYSGPTTQPSAPSTPANLFHVGHSAAAPLSADTNRVEFNPFAENPLLRALQGPERAASPSFPPRSDFLGSASPLSNPISAPTASHPHSHLTSPRSPELQSPSMGHHVPGQYSAFSSMHSLHAVPPTPATPSSAAAPEPPTDHILSIMSILEPDLQSSSPISSSYMSRSQGQANNAARSSGRQQLGSSTGETSQMRSIADMQQTPRQGAVAKPLPSQHALPGLGQGAAFSIWSDTAAASEQQGMDSWAMHSAASTPSAVDVKQGARDSRSRGSPVKPAVVSNLSSAAPPWTGSAGSTTSTGTLGITSRSLGTPPPTHQSAADMAALLPASLLPASLDIGTSSSSSGAAPRSGARTSWQSSGGGAATATSSSRQALAPTAAPWVPQNESWLMGLPYSNGGTGVYMGPKPGAAALGVGVQGQKVYSQLPDTLWSGGQTSTGFLPTGMQGGLDAGMWGATYGYTPSGQPPTWQ